MLKNVIKVPRGRFLELNELTSLVCWLSSEENSFSTAAVFDISGGRSTYFLNRLIIVFFYQNSFDNTGARIIKIYKKYKKRKVQDFSRLKHSYFVVKINIFLSTIQTNDFSLIKSCIRKNLPNTTEFDEQFVKNIKEIIKINVFIDTKYIQIMYFECLNLV